MRGIATMLATAALVLGAVACGGKKDGSGEAGSEAATAAGKAEPAGAQTPATAKSAAGTKPKGEHAKERKRASPASYAKALARGRKLINAGDASGAVAEFAAASKLRPRDPMALSELSWAAFKAGDLAAARQAAESSIAYADKDPTTKAASLFNLGKIAEAEQRQDAAVDAYQRSYELRPHRVVRKRLEELGAKVPKSVWTAKALAGPFATLADYCATLGVAGSDWHSETYCAHPKAAPESKLDGKVPWSRTVVYFESLTGDDLPEVNLGFETDRGWFVLFKFDLRGNRYDWTIDRVTVAGNSIAIHHSNHEGRFAYEDNKLLTVCGLGASGSPSCFGPITLFESYTDYEGGKEDGHSLPKVVLLDCTAELDEAERLVITARDKECRNKASFAGEHDLHFP